MPNITELKDRVDNKTGNFVLLTNATVSLYLAALDKGKHKWK